MTVQERIGRMAIALQDAENPRGDSVRLAREEVKAQLERAEASERQGLDNDLDQEFQDFQTSKGGALTREERREFAKGAKKRRKGLAETQRERRRDNVPFNAPEQQPGEEGGDGGGQQAAQDLQAMGQTTAKVLGKTAAGMQAIGQVARQNESVIDQIGTTVDAIVQRFNGAGRANRRGR